MDMFCYQCEQTAKGEACTVHGVCGKNPTTADLQDLLIHETKGISSYADESRKLGVKDFAIDRFISDALFMTVTNVNFDPEAIRQMIEKAIEMRRRAKGMYEKACKGEGMEPGDIAPPMLYSPGDDLDTLVQKGRKVGIDSRRKMLGEIITGLQELLMYGLKGMGSYAHHAAILGEEDDDVYAFFHKALHTLANEETDTDKLTSMCLECGKVNLRVMELLDRGHTKTYGHPEPTEVRIHPKKGKAIVVSGHDMKDLEELLKQTEGKGINVYTHGEMLPAHGYPGLKKYKHLAGNYGGAWQDQQREFAAFPGAILMTTNCLQKPQASYQDRIFTRDLVGWPGVTHLSDTDFKPVIDAALEAEGFQEDGPDDTIIVGFGHNAVKNVADKVIEAVKKGDIRHFFLIGGCDGARLGRNYYTEIAKAVPDDCVILTLACGKYRFNKIDFGEIDGIPRLLDVGQCNDAYSAVVIAQMLADAFDTDVNSLPLSMILSWYEQKAVVILLTLLHLGIENMRLGPSLPAFIEEPVLKTLNEMFGLKPIETPDADLAAALGER